MENGTKSCNKCNKILSIESFCKDSSRKDGHSSTCKKCHSLYRKNHWKKTQNDPELKQKETLRRRAAFKKWCASGKQKAYRESSPERWFNEKISSIRRSAESRKISFNIDKDLLVKLWHNQDGRCAITGVPMLLKHNSLFSASADRIDSQIGYESYNVQLVCKAINLGKSDHSVEEFLEFLSAIKDGE